jgi:hypothetical protein
MDGRVRATSDDSRTIGSQHIGIGDFPTRVGDTTGEARVGAPIQVVPGNAAESVDILVLLRYRMRVLVLITLANFGFLQAMRFVRLDLTAAEISQVILPGMFYLDAMVVLAVILWRRRTYTLIHLRSLESLLFGITTLFFVEETYRMLFVQSSRMLSYVERHPSEMSILAREPSVIWMALIIAYGTFIPNTARRCAVVTSLMALSPLITVALGGIFHAVPRRPLLLFLSEMLTWMGFGVAMAIYGSHKIAPCVKRYWLRASWDNTS